ncbi:unnamed protein product [Peronospora destructor]|uniref:Aquaporin n=1 Tax=Peronospora destructor TaxID=86335 RepID=A0AAV0TK57_9STRA|nr:unnamed protein product [Peronospora destructor]
MEYLSASDISKDKDGYYYGIQDADVAKMPTPPPKSYQIKSPLLRECMAEFLGTMVLIMFGDGVVAQVVLSEGSKGGYFNINLCWGLGVLFGIHVIRRHLGRSSESSSDDDPRPLRSFRAAQSDSVYTAQQSTEGIFAMYPYSSDVPVSTCFLTEVVSTALLLGGIFALGDELNKPASPYAQPVVVALLVVAIGMAFGMNSGYAINPARDFGPRLFSLCAGWGSRVFTI